MNTIVDEVNRNTLNASPDAIRRAVLSEKQFQNQRIWVGIVTQDIDVETSTFVGSMVLHSGEIAVDNDFADISVICQEAEIPNVTIGDYFLAIKKFVPNNSGYAKSLWLCIGLYGRLINSSDMISSEDFFSSEDYISSDMLLSSIDIISSGELLSSMATLSSGQIVSSQGILSSGQLLSTDDYLSSGYLFSSGGLLSSNELISSGELLSSKDTLSSGDLLSSGDTLSSGDLLSSDDLLSSGELLSSNDRLSSGEFLSSGEVLSSDSPSSGIGSSGVPSSDSPSSDSPSSNVQSSGAPSSEALSSDKYDGDECLADANCADSTPRFIKATFTGISIADGCYDCDNEDISYSSVPDINGSYILEQVSGDPCRWRYRESLSASRTVHTSTDGTCTGGTPTNYNGLQIQAYYSGSNMALSAALTVSSWSDANLIFSGSDSGPTDCAEGAYINQNAGPNGCSTNAGDGGSASTKGVYVGL